jgi:guanylate kinase
MSPRNPNTTFELSGKCLIFSAPSGAGKTTLVHYLLRQLDSLEFSVSATSRAPRGREENGVDYHFLSVEDFKSKISEEAFIEWEEVYKDNFYGTLKTEVQRAWRQGKTVVFDVDAEGGINLKKIFGENALSIFIKPPSLFVLEQRLRDRRTEDEESIKKRLGKAQGELDKAVHFDTILLNDNLEKACHETQEIVTNFING